MIKELSANTHRRLENVKFVGRFEKILHDLRLHYHWKREMWVRLNRCRLGVFLQKIWRIRGKCALMRNFFEISNGEKNCIGKNSREIGKNWKKNFFSKFWIFETNFFLVFFLFFFENWKIKNLSWKKFLKIKFFFIFWIFLKN